MIKFYSHSPVASVTDVQILCPEGKEYIKCALGVYEIYFAETPQIESKMLD